MLRLVPVFAAVLLSCAAERTQLPPSLDPSNPDAPESAPYAVTERESLGGEGQSSQETGGGHGAHLGPSDRIDGGTGAQGASHDGAHGHTANPSDAHEKTDDTPHQLESHDSHDVEPAHSADAGTLLYVCPMHPEVTSSKPGRCPKCGMKLVPQERK